MHLPVPVTTKNAFTRIPLVFFSGFCVFILWFFVSVWPLTIRLEDFTRISCTVFLLFYLISFFGMVKLPGSFPGKPDLKNYTLPFRAVTASGIFLCALTIVLTGTVWQWPLVPIANLLLDMSVLLLTVAMTVLLLPFIREMKPCPVFSYGILVLVSLISAGIVFRIILTDILPLFDPEFIWSEFWIFGSSHFDLELLRSGSWGPGTVLTNLLSWLYVVFVMPILGLVSLHIIHKATRQDPSPENKQVGA